MVSRMLGKLRKTVQNPGRTFSYGWQTARTSLRKLRRRWMLLSGDSTFLVREIEGSRMLLDGSDPGISLTLALDGVHEPEMTRVYKRELGQLGKVVDSPIVVDIGANIGYYACMPLPVLGPEVTVIAIEPEPSNFRLLRLNVLLNEYEDAITVRNHAIGASETTAILEVNQQSNINLLKHHSEAADGVEVGVQPLSAVLAEEGVNPGDIDVVRMDVEGSEAAVFDGMEAVLAADSWLLMNIEIHVPHLDETELERVLGWLRRDNVEVITFDPGGIEVNSIDEIPDAKWVHLIARRTPSGQG